MTTPSEDYVRTLVELAARIQHLTADELLARGHSTIPSETRQAVYLVLRDQGWGLARIGGAMGRDHTTIHHGVAKARARARMDADFAYLVRELRTAAGLAQPLIHDARRPDDWLRAHIAIVDEAIERATAARAHLADVLDVVLRARDAAERPVVTRVAS